LSTWAKPAKPKPVPAVRKRSRLLVIISSQM
jgi:hypothetical protein